MTYRPPVRPEGLRAAFRSLVRREYRQVDAVVDMSFELSPGEVVGFLGPNGAGKTTTLKILSGILHPTAGEARVLGHVPAQRKYVFLKQIALVRGSQPIGGPTELTVHDNLRYQQLLYDVCDDDFRANLAELTDLLRLEPLLDRQLRALSLGERMRCGLAASLIYRPRVLFLDEPTIGLDVSAAAALRTFVTSYAERTEATVLVTSHHMADVEQLCPRVLLIDHGRLQYDGILHALATQMSPYKLVRLTVPEDGVQTDWTTFGEVAESTDGSVVLQVNRESVANVTGKILASIPVLDLTVTDPPLEAVMRQFHDRVER